MKSEIRIVEGREYRVTVLPPTRRRVKSTMAYAKKNPKRKNGGGARLRRWA